MDNDDTLARLRWTLTTMASAQALLAGSVASLAGRVWLLQDEDWEFLSDGQREAIEGALARAEELRQMVGGTLLTESYEATEESIARAVEEEE